MTEARARTTGAPVQHWFGPSGDVRAGGENLAGNLTHRTFVGIDSIEFYCSGGGQSYKMLLISSDVSNVHSGWWFGTSFIFPYLGNNHPN